MQEVLRKQTRKIIVSIVVCLTLCVGALHAQTNSSISIFENASVIETEYFDIIFTENSKSTAQYLAEHADALYEKAAELLGVEVLLHMPVVITQKTDVLNAYFTIFPYDRIVLYDTLPTQSLSVFDDTILSVFYHELIHAVTFKNSLTNNPINDFLTPFITVINIAPSISEGTAVLAESLDGYGRLNNSYSMHVVRQALIENVFPAWGEIAGSRTLYTDGSLPYIFGGAFFEYLYVTYGQEKLIEFWDKTATIDFLNYVGTFKKVYGLSLDDLWDGFKDSIELPLLTTASDPLNTDNRLFQSLTASDSHLVWQDAYTCDVYATELTKELKTTFLFHSSLSDRITFSNDGNYLIISGELGLDREKNKARVYDFNKRRFISSHEDIRDAAMVSLTDATIFSENNTSPITQLIVGVETNGQYSSIELYNFENNEHLRSLNFSYGEIVLEPIDVGNNTIVAMVKNKGHWQIFVYDVKNDTQHRFSFDETSSPTNIASPRVANDHIYFSYAQSKNTQPVLAKIPIDQLHENTVSVQIEADQRSGGVFSPLSILDANGDEHIVHISRFYEKRTLSTYPVESTSYNSIILARDDSVIDMKELPKAFPIKNYNPFAYYSSGLFIPIVGSVNLNQIDSNFYNTISLGATSAVIDPTERLLVVSGFGYDFFLNNYSATLSTLFTERNFTLTTDSYAGVNFEGVEQAASRIYADFYIPIASDFSRIGFANTFRWFYQKNTSDYFYKGNSFDNVTSVYISSLKNSGSSPHEILGATLYYQFQIEKYSGNARNVTNDLLAGTILRVDTYIPRLLPFINPFGYTVNLPFRFHVTKYFDFYYGWSLEGDVVLFSYDIQKPLYYLFFQRVTLDAGAKYLHYSDETYDVTVMASLYTTAALNTTIAAGYAIDVGLAAEWHPLQDANEALTLKLKFGLNF